MPYSDGGRGTSFDAVLVISFGGPGGPADVRPFLENVLRGRRVSPGRVEEVARHYDHFRGVSPLTELTLRHAHGLEERLAQSETPLPVYVGMRNWHPLLADTLAHMSRSGVRRAVGFIAAAHHSYSSCTQYKENVRDAREALRQAGLPDVEVTYVDSWFDHDGFVSAIAAQAETALGSLDPDLRSLARLVFTAHSIPVPMAESCRYVQQLETTCRRVSERLQRGDHTLVFQSRSGRPTDPWLEPDICDFFRRERAAGLEAAVVIPVGFLCDHIEVLWDLDVEAAQVCREIGLPMVRAATVGDHPLFLGMMADVVGRTCRRFRIMPPLPIVAP
jgi:ferrochelatase